MMVAGWEKEHLSGVAKLERASTSGHSRPTGASKAVTSRARDESLMAGGKSKLEYELGEEKRGVLALPLNVECGRI